MCTVCCQGWWHSIWHWLLTGEGYHQTMCWDGTVIAFCSSKEMLAMTHLITSATAWHDDPVRLSTRPPTAAQIWDYIAVRDKESLWCPAPTHEGFVSTTLTQWWGTQPQFHLALWDLDDASSEMMLSEVYLETARRGGCGTPSRAACGSGRGSWHGSQSWQHRWGNVPSGGEGMGT